MADSENNSGQLISKSINLNRYIVWTCVFWTLFVGVSLARDFWQQKNSVYQSAKLTALTALKKDLVYRRWASIYGGVYIPVTEKTLPNPYLSHIKERDITTTSGKKLTLVNPAYMTRQVHELGNEQYGVRGHITSLKPIRPENAPDKWERQALEAFISGEQEITGIIEMDGQRYMRLMRPMITKENCLKCHAQQGYKLGDIRGGISISVPLESYLAIARASVTSLSFCHGLLWLVGVAGIGYGGKHLEYQLNRRRAIEKALQDSEELHRITLANISDAVFITDDNGTFTYICPNVDIIFSFSIEQVKQMENISRFLGEELFDNNQLISEREIQNIEREITDTSGQPHTLLINVKRVSIKNGTILYTCRDITKRKQAEEQAKICQAEMLHMSRLSTIGEMASGLAHELNQPLCAAINYTNACLHHIRAGNTDMDKLIENMEAAAIQNQRAGDIINSIKNFVKKHELHRTMVNINNIIRGLYDFIGADIRRNQVSLNLELDEQVPVVLADRIHIEQVLLNLILNGIVAMCDVETEKRQMTIQTKITDHTIEVAVCDTGRGLSEDVRKKMFNSFFTTKTDGLGIGLSISQSIIKAHKGRFWADTNTECGTIFRFTLPVAQMKA